MLVVRVLSLALPMKRQAAQNGSGSRSKQRKAAQNSDGSEEGKAPLSPEKRREGGTRNNNNPRMKKKNEKKKKLEKLKKMWFAAVTRDEEEVVKLLAANPTLSDANNLARHPSALHIAAFHGFDTIVVALLLQQKTAAAAAAEKEMPASSSSSLVDDQTGWTVLHVAAGQGRDKVVEHLLLLLAAKGSPSSTSFSCSSSSSSSSSFSSIVDATDFDGCTALHHAARSGSCRVVELLLAASPALLDVVDKDGCTALLYAVKRRHEEIVNHLLALNPKNLDAGADADGVVASGMNVLHHAISQDNETLVWRLLEMRPDLIYKPSRSGFTPLSMAMRFPFVMKLFALYSPQAVATLTAIDKSRLLREAVWAMEENKDGGEIGLDLLLPISTLDELEVAFEAQKYKKLRCAGQVRAFVEAQCAILAMMVLNQDVMGIVYEYLFGGGAKSEAAEESEVSSDAREKRRREEQWFEAAVEDDEKLMAQLLEEDPTLIDSVTLRDTSTTYGGKTALHTASYEGCDRVVALLLAVKPSLAAVRDDNGNTALHLTRNAKIVEMLLAVSPSSGLIANFEGTTALMEAAEYGRLAKLQLLLAACPEALDMVDQHQRTALLCAAYSCHHGIVRLLLAAKPRNVRAAESGGWNILHREVSSRYLIAENVQEILAIDPGLVRTLTTSLQTPLWLAVKTGRHNEVIEDLFHRFPHAVHMADASGRTPYDIAVQNNNSFAVDLFS